VTSRSRYRNGWKLSGTKSSKTNYPSTARRTTIHTNTHIHTHTQHNASPHSTAPTLHVFALGWAVRFARDNVHIYINKTTIIEFSPTHQSALAFHFYLSIVCFLYILLHSVARKIMYAVAYTVSSITKTVFSVSVFVYICWNLSCSHQLFRLARTCTLPPLA
jgi:hypothetical protein